MGFLEVLWSIVVAFLFVAYLFVLWFIIADLFRDHKLNGWWKALWIVFLIFLPVLTALVYLIARGKGMAERQEASAKADKAATDAYIRQTAGQPTDPAAQLTAAKSLLDAGGLTQEEYDQLKRQILAG